jgi:hypothetical protein
MKTKRSKAITAFGRSGVVGIPEHDGDWLIVERKSLDSVDDPARSLQAGFM